ncbi:MAG: nickel pincer cofactor biosynthesis protein LarB [Spirochaetaceae bacterium]|jgi:NCAIR mutase (PurE)-related protein|nr:nickel pincer cofactor biosynthesis protein LarB [Spirochaetaceae bacterium]
MKNAYPQNSIQSVLEKIKNGALSIAEGEAEISALYTGDLGFAAIDLRRHERTGFPEVIFCAGKTDEQAAAIIREMYQKGIPVLGTKARPSLAERLTGSGIPAVYDIDAKTLTLGKSTAEGRGLVVVAAAGTSDLGAAKEAAVTAEFFGSNTKLITDIGVAGIHRLFGKLDEIRRARAIVAVAGMEGALAGVLAGLVSVPVIALPTSVGYGASFGGLSALLGMLTSCAPGVSVVNIDNGFGAGYQANLINQGCFKQAAGQ